MFDKFPESECIRSQIVQLEKIFPGTLLALSHNPGNLPDAMFKRLGCMPHCYDTPGCGYVENK